MSLRGLARCLWSRRVPRLLQEGVRLRGRLEVCRFLTAGALTYVDVGSLLASRGVTVWVLRKASRSWGLRGLT